MTVAMYRLPALIVIAALSAGLTACGGENETNAPSVALTASTVASTTVSSHTHSVTVPFSDVSTAPPSATLQYRSDTVSGHSHVIALSSQQMIDLNSGMRLSLTSSPPDSGIDHTHVWNIQGGSVLYEKKNCYNCHSNDKRNNRPMNVTFNASQTAAVINPATAPVSSSLAVTPDPNYAVSSGTPVNAASVYAGRCAGCHSLGTVDPVTPGDIGPSLSGKGSLVTGNLGKFPVPGVVSHRGQTLSAAEITALIAYFTIN